MSIYAYLVCFGITVFAGMFICEFGKDLRDHKWNLWKTLVDFIREF